LNSTGEKEPQIAYEIPKSNPCQKSAPRFTTLHRIARCHLPYFIAILAAMLSPGARAPILLKAPAPLNQWVCYQQFEAMALATSCTSGIRGFGGLCATILPLVSSLWGRVPVIGSMGGVILPKATKCFLVALQPPCHAASRWCPNFSWCTTATAAPHYAFTTVF